MRPPTIRRPYSPSPPPPPAAQRPPPPPVAAPPSTRPTWPKPVRSALPRPSGSLASSSARSGSSPPLLPSPPDRDCRGSRPSSSRSTPEDSRQAKATRSPSHFDDGHKGISTSEIG